MIFAALGTHGDPMPRLVAALELVARTTPQLGPFEIQHGTSALPAGWTGAAHYPTDEMAARMRVADLVVTHGGPATIAMARAAGKIPIVVPRLAQHGEHVDDHQLWYGRHLERLREVVTCEPNGELPSLIQGYAAITATYPAPGLHDSAAAIARFGDIAHALLRR